MAARARHEVTSNTCSKKRPGVDCHQCHQGCTDSPRRSDGILTVTDLAVAWDAYSRTKPARRTANAAGQRTWFNWTAHADHGPSENVLAPVAGARILELGCGKGGNIAHLATLGVRALGVDPSPLQIEDARERWGHLPTLTLRHGDAIEYLASSPQWFDAIYSVFGALWFVDPDLWLPVVWQRLAPGGRLAFSHRPPFHGCYGCQAAFIRHGDQEPFVIRRWDYTPVMWNGWPGTGSHTLRRP